MLRYVAVALVEGGTRSKEVGLSLHLSAVPIAPFTGLAIAGLIFGTLLIYEGN